MAKPRVLVTRRMAEEALALIREATDTYLWPEDTAPPYETLVAEASRSDGLLCMLEDRVDEGLIQAAAPRLRVISQMAVGVDNVDVEAATRRGIPVGHTPGVLAPTVADLAFALILASARRVAEGDRYVRQGRWKGWHPTFFLGYDVHGATLGILGLGGTGTEVAKRARGFSMRIIYHSRTRKPHLEAELGLEWRPDMDSVLREADIVTLHVPLSAETRHLIGQRELGLMKPSAILVNTTRGPVVDPGALYQALKGGVISGAALDVTEPEPLPPDDPLLTLENLVVTPHIGSASVATRTGMAVTAARNLLAGLRGEPLLHCVNADALKR